MAGTGQIADFQTGADDTAVQALADAQAFIDVIKEIATGFEVGKVQDPSGNFIDLPDRITEMINALRAGKPVKPSLPELDTQVPNTRTLSEIDTTNVNNVDIPDLIAESPVLNYPATPTPVMPEDPGTPPTFNAPTMPESPTFTLPAVPTITSPAIPAAPSLAYPTFAGTTPVDDLVVPSNNFVFNEEAYSSVILTALKLKLSGDLNDGGYGIEPADEEALFARTRDRENRNGQARMAEIDRMGAASGFALPTGAELVAKLEVLKVTQDAIAESNRGITLERSRLYNETRKHVIDSSITLENILINYHGSVQERALNAQKSILDAGVAIFDAQVRAYNARLDAYKTEADVYQAKLQALVAQVDVYKTQLEAARLEGDIQKIEVDLYTAIVNATQSTIEIYKTQMQAAGIQADIEKLQMDAYTAKVGAYSERIKAAIAEFDMYKAQIDGETAKITAYEAEVGAYKARVEAASAKVGAEVAKVNADISANELQLEEYKAEITGFSAKLDAVTSQIRALLDSYGVEVTAWGQESRGILDSYGVAVESEKANLEAFTEYEKMKIQAAEANIKALLTEVELRVKAGEAGAEIYKALVLGALSAVTSLAAAIETTSG